MKIAIVGSGYVGSVAGACFAELGHDVTVIDSDARKVQALQNGQLPIHEQYLPELLARHAGKRLHFTTDLRGPVSQSAAVFIAVGTPPLESGEPDLSYVDSVVREIAGAIQNYTVIVEKSTVPALTSEWIRRTMRLHNRHETDFDVVSNPEFLREGTAVADFLYPDRIVIGSSTSRATELMKEIYQPIMDKSYRKNPFIPVVQSAPVVPDLIVTDPSSAELIKHASNAFLAMKISFINAVSNVCEAVRGNIEDVCKGIGTDSRIGQKFLRPGIGYGGSCFPKDVSAFRALSSKCGYEFSLLKDVEQINLTQQLRFVAKVKEALWTLRNKRIAALGLAYKGGTDDVRESPAIAIIERLLAEGCEVVAFDPAAKEKAREVLRSDRVQYADSAYEAMEDADALVILTDWDEFTKLDVGKMRDALRHPIVIDGRNLLKPDRMASEGFIYYSVGRSAVTLDHVAAAKQAASNGAQVVEAKK
jgi:UDPglucose 6-dehydrogenase